MHFSMKQVASKFNRLLIAAFFPLAALAATQPTSPRLLVHLLEYLSSDYAGAVSDQGRIISASEYKEQGEFASSALETARGIPEIRNQPNLEKKFEELKGLIDRRAAPSRVAGLARALKEQVVRLARLSDAPEQWPSLSRGRELYRRNCQACHGEQGAGDGPAAAALNPKPANFLGEELSKAIFPFRAFNSVRLGVPGTAMAAWPQLSDRDTWDLAFFVTSLHMKGKTSRAKSSPADLPLASTRSDEQLMASLSGTEQERREKIVALRLRSSDDEGSGNSGGGGKDSLAVARKNLDEAEKAFLIHDYPTAREKALLAYLEGVEPVEPKLESLDPAFLAGLETRMATLRSIIEAKRPVNEFQAGLASARQALDQAEAKLAPQASSPWLIFFLTAGILLREGFEAVLILIALLAVIRASDSKTAARYVHAGWTGALVLGLGAWFVSGWLIFISGAAREKLEGYTSLLAVAILLYVGFWLHRRTEISRWKHFIEDQVKAMLTGSRLWGLAAIAFMAVFREAFETVLFLRAITLESGAGGSAAMALGVASSLSLTFLISWLLLNTSARLPIRRIFTFSSLLMVALSVILTGKGIHALQEAGVLSFTYWSGNSPLSAIRSDFLGVYPTWESIIPQAVVLAIVVLIWRWNSSPSRAKRVARASMG